MKRTLIRQEVNELLKLNELFAKYGLDKLAIINNDKVNVNTLMDFIIDYCMRTGYNVHDFCFKLREKVGDY